MGATEILSIATKILDVVITLVIIFILPKVKAWINSKLTEEQQKLLVEQVSTYVKAADQLLKKDDPDGSLRKKYVVEALLKVGIELTEQVNAIIEAEVFKL